MQSKIFTAGAAAFLTVWTTATWADPPVITLPYDAQVVPARSGKYAPPAITIPHDAPRYIAFPKPVPAAIVAPPPPSSPPVIAEATPAPQPQAAGAARDAGMAAAVAAAAMKGVSQGAAASVAQAASAAAPLPNDVTHAQPAQDVALATPATGAAASPLAAGGSVPAERLAAGTAVPPTGPSAATLPDQLPDVVAEQLLDEQAGLEAQNKLAAIAHITGKSADQEQRRQGALRLLRERRGRQALAEAAALSDELGSELSRKYKVAAGENLRSIAGKPEVYGNTDLWPLLLQANELDRPEQIREGTELDVPLHPSPGQVVSALAYAHDHGTW